MNDTQQILMNLMKEVQDSRQETLQEVKESRKETQQWRETLVGYIAKTDQKIETINNKVDTIGNQWWSKEGKQSLDKLVDAESDKKIYRGVVATALIGIVGERAFHLFFK